MITRGSAKISALKLSQQQNFPRFFERFKYLTPENKHVFYLFFGMSSKQLFKTCFFKRLNLFIKALIETYSSTNTVPLARPLTTASRSSSLLKKKRNLKTLDLLFLASFQQAKQSKERICRLKLSFAAARTAHSYVP